MDSSSEGGRLSELPALLREELHSNVVLAGEVSLLKGSSGSVLSSREKGWGDYFYTSRWIKLSRVISSS